MSDFNPKNILVTGGAGFIGCNYVRFMLMNYGDVKIVNLDALTYAGSLDNLKGLPAESRHTFVQGDICDRPLIDKLCENMRLIRWYILPQKAMWTIQFQTLKFSSEPMC